MADLFISYGRVDRARVAPLVAALESEGWSVWWDPEIVPGQEFDRMITEELDKARAVIVVWTSTSVESRWVRGEAREGAERSVLVPVRFDKAQPPIDLRSIHTTDLDGWGEDATSPAFRELARALRVLAPEHSGPLNSPDESRALHPADPAVVPTATPGKRRRWRRIAAALGVSAMAVLALAVWRLGQPTEASTSIAVQRVTAPAGDGPAQAFADRLAGDLATMAAARPTSLRIVQPAAGDPAHQQGFIVGGTARTVAQNITATVNVSSTRDNSIVWSASFSRPVAQAADLPDQAATRMADVLTCALPRGEPAYHDVEVLRLFMTACATINDPDATDRAVSDQLRRVVALAPNFASAWGELAISDAYVLAESNSPSTVSSRRTVENDAANALRLNPREARAWTGRAVAMFGVRNWLQRRAYLEKALVLDPEQSWALFDLGFALEGIGRERDSLAAMRRAADADPLSPIQLADLAYSEAGAGLMGESAATFSAAARRWPGNSLVAYKRAAVNARMGDAAEALKAFDGQDLQLEPVERQYWRLLCQARLDPRRTAEAAAFMRAHAGNDLHVEWVISGLAELGRVDDAFEIAESNLAQLGDSRTVTGGLFRPDMTRFVASPRFMPLAARLGLIDVWRKTGLWPDYCSGTGAPYDCKAEAAKAMAVIGKPA